MSKYLWFFLVISVLSFSIAGTVRIPEADARMAVPSAAELERWRKATGQDQPGNDQGQPPTVKPPAGSHNQPQIFVNPVPSGPSPKPSKPENAASPK